jgi:histidine triad (HIT) family protein
MELYDSNNIFAKILKKEIKANIRYEDENILAFDDISKTTPIHVLVIPKGNYINYLDFTTNAPAEIISNFFIKVGEIAKDLKIDQSGFRFITNNGNDAHQTVKHFHVHLLAGKKLGPLINN